MRKIATLILMTVFYAVSLCIVLWTEQRNRRWYALAKGACSSLFLLCGIWQAYAAGTVLAGATLLLLGALFLCACGDVMLGIANQRAKKLSRKPFLFGSGSFAAAHLLFCVLFYGIIPGRWYDLLLMLLLVIFLYWLEYTKKIRLKSMRPLAYVYTILIALMTSKAVQVSWQFESGVVLGLGAILFMVSDVLLLFMYFGVRRKSWLRVANLLSYYIGVYLMAITAGRLR